MNNKVNKKEGCSRRGSGEGPGGSYVFSGGSYVF